MRKIRKKRNAMRVATALSISAIAIMPVFAEGWQHNDKGWWFGTNATNTTWHANGWQWLDGNNDGVAECYYFDQNGYILANGTTPDGFLVNADGQWVVNGAIQKKSVGASVLNEQNGNWMQTNGIWQWKNTDGTFRTNGWHWLDGNRDGVAECYYFDANGFMVATGTTPDGFLVNADGAWINNGQVQTKKLSVSGGPGGGTTSSTGKVSSGGGGGGSSSGGGGGSSSSGSSSSSSSSGSSGSSSSSSSSSSSKTAEQEAVDAAILEFKKENITSDMTDFEKEIKIIQWLTKNCTYKRSADPSDWTYATAYSCIINGEAQCSGYANAFLETAKACGLTVQYIVLPKANHAINTIKLDGEFYYVDVTWADGDDSNASFLLGYGKARSIFVGDNAYVYCSAINVTWKEAYDAYEGDSKINTSYNAVKYGPDVVYEAMKTPEQKAEEAEAARREEESNAAIVDVINAYKNDDNKLFVECTTEKEAANQIVEYLSERIKRKDADYNVCVVISNKISADSVASKVNTEICNTYIGDLDWKTDTFKLTTPESTKYATTKQIACSDGKFPYRNDKIKYTVNYIYNGVTVDSSSELVSKGTSVSYSIPAGYEYVSASVEGTGTATVKEDSFVPSSNGVVVNVTVKPLAILKYTLQFVCGKNVIYTENKFVTSGTTVNYVLPSKDYEYINAESSDDKSTINDKSFTVNTNGAVFTVYVRDVESTDDATGKYAYILNYMYNGEVVSTGKRYATPNQTLYFGSFTDIDGNKYVPKGNCNAKDTYQVTITEDEQIVNIDTNLVKASDEITTASLIDDELAAEIEAAATENSKVEDDKESLNEAKANATDDTAVNNTDEVKTTDEANKVESSKENSTESNDADTSNDETTDASKQTENTSEKIENKAESVKEQSVETDTDESSNAKEAETKEASEEIEDSKEQAEEVDNENLDELMEEK